MVAATAGLAPAAQASVKAIHCPTASLSANADWPGGSINPLQTVSGTLGDTVLFADQCTFTDSGQLPSATASSAGAQSPMLFSIEATITGTYSAGPGCTLNSTVHGYIDSMESFGSDEVVWAAVQTAPAGASAGISYGSFWAYSADFTLSTAGGVGAIDVKSISLSDPFSGQTISGSGAGTASVDPPGVANLCGYEGTFKYLIHNLSITLS